MRFSDKCPFEEAIGCGFRKSDRRVSAIDRGSRECVFLFTKQIQGSEHHVQVAEPPYPFTDKGFRAYVQIENEHKRSPKTPNRKNDRLVIFVADVSEED